MPMRCPSIAKIFQCAGSGIAAIPCGIIAGTIEGTCRTLLYTLDTLSILMQFMFIAPFTRQIYTFFPEYKYSSDKVPEGEDEDNRRFQFCRYSLPSAQQAAKWFAKNLFLLIITPIRLMYNIAQRCLRIGYNVYKLLSRLPKLPKALCSNPEMLNSTLKFVNTWELHQQESRFPRTLRLLKLNYTGVPTCANEKTRQI